MGMVDNRNCEDSARGVSIKIEEVDSFRLLEEMEFLDIRNAKF